MPRPKGIKSRMWTKEEDALLIQMHATQRAGTRVVASTLNRTITSVRGRLYKLKKKSPVVRQFGVRAAYFDTWSADMAYTLGYIWADGTVEYRLVDGYYYVGRLSLRCTEQDAYIIRQIGNNLGVTCKELTTNGGMVPFPANKSGVIRSKPLVVVRVNSIELTRSLIEKHGVLPNKSYVNPPYKQIPDEFIGDFARGYFDGDGTIYVRNPRSTMIYLYGSDSFLSGLSQQLHRVLGIKESPVYRNRSLGALAWGRRLDVQALCRAFYGKEGMCLERKRDKLSQAVQW